MKNSTVYSFVLRSVCLGLSLGFAPVPAPDITGSWRMTAHQIAPAKDGITDLYGHFKELYGGCQKDMGVVLNADKTVRITPAGGCQNPLGNLIMKTAARFMPSGNVTWDVNADKVSLQDKKGQRREYTLQQSGSDMQWLFDETDGPTTVHHTIVFKRD